MGCLVPRFGGAPPLLCFGTSSSLSSSLKDDGFGFFLIGGATEESESARWSRGSFASVITTGESFGDRSISCVSTDLAEGLAAGDRETDRVASFPVGTLADGSGSSSVSVAESNSICSCGR